LSDPTSLRANDPLSPPPDPSNQLLPESPGPSTPYKIFFGKDGLRAGWGLLIFIVLMFLFLQGMTAFLKLTHLVPKPNPAQTEISPTFGFYSEFLPFLITLIVTWIMSKIEKRPNGVYGLGGQRPLSRFFGGLAWGVTCLSLVIFTLWKTGLLVFDGRLLSGTVALHYALIWLLGFLMVGLLEEYLTRGYLLFTLTRGLAGIYSWLFKTPHSKALGFWTAAIILSVLFGLGHGKNPGESPIGLLSAGLASLVFCLSLWRTGSLWWAIGFHTSWDWAQSYLYGVADSGLMVQRHLLATHAVGTPIMSGGTTGPEGSIFVLPILAIVCLIIIFTLSPTNYGDTAVV
jgi:membrane protease YdiL (CAAX protease family)